MEEKKADKSLKDWILLIYIFAIIFFPLGFYTLLAGPSKWIIEASLKYSWSEYHEKLIQQFVIVLLIILSIKLAILFKKFFLSDFLKVVRIISISFLSIIFLLSMYLFSFKPEVFIKLSGKGIENLMQSSVNETGQTVEFVLGAYPELKDLERLHAAGYTAVVSLLHKMVLPAEPNLIEEEIKNAGNVGIELIQIPMLPWISGNNESIIKIQKLAKEGKGKYYVHCYLGRDRVNIFRKIVQDVGAKSGSLQEKLLIRHIDDLKSFERGVYTKISKDVYLTPFPTDDEFFGYIVNGQFATVVSFLDPNNQEDTLWINKEELLLKRYGVKYVNLPISDYRNTAAIKYFMDSFPKIKRPVVLHKYLAKDPLYEVLKTKLLKIIR